VTRALPLFVAGQLVIFAVGVPWLAVVADLSLAQALDAGFYPFIVGGLVKAALAGALLPAAWRLVGRER
jgi:biotin transport system substrate-specific component